jgi:hypothetical protein
LQSPGVVVLHLEDPMYHCSFPSGHSGGVECPCCQCRSFRTAAPPSVRNLGTAVPASQGGRQASTHCFCVRHYRNGRSVPIGPVKSGSRQITDATLTAS